MHARRLRGQISAEFSMLLLVSVVVLGLVVASATAIASTVNEGIEVKKNKYDEANLREYAREVCMSGSGSSRPLQLITEVKNLSFNLPCKVDADFPLSGRVLIKNEDGKVKIT